MQIDVRNIDRLLGELTRINSKLDEAVASECYPVIGGLDEVTATLKELLVIGCTSDQADVRRCSIYGLSKICEPAEAEVLLASVGDSDPAVRAWAIEGLGRLTVKSAVPVLIASLGDFDSFVYYSTVLALRRFSPDIVIGPLIESLNNKNSLVRQRAAKLIGSIKDSRAVDALMDHFQQDEPSVRYEIIEALCQIGSTKANRVYIAALEDNTYEVRCAAIKGLRKSGDDSAVEPLVQVALFYKEHRAAAIDALTQLCGIEAIWPLHRMIKEVNLKARDVASGLIKTRSMSVVLPNLWDYAHKSAIN